jgi:hypothetical protein
MHFQSDDWLKLALLTWDTVARVRPRDLEDRDDEVVREIRAETSFLIDMVPSTADLQDVRHSFNDVLSVYRKEVVERYGLDRADAWSQDLRYQPPASQIYVPDDRLFWVYCGPGGARIDNALRTTLVSEGLAREAPDGQPWVGIDSSPRLRLHGDAN